MWGILFLIGHIYQGHFLKGTSRVWSDVLLFFISKKEFGEGVSLYVINTNGNCYYVEKATGILRSER